MKIGSTKPRLNVDIWSGNHQFYTGSQKIFDTEGRVERFMRKYGIENHLSFSLNHQFKDFLKKENVKIILLIRKRLTNSSLALTKTVSNKLSLFLLKNLIIFSEGNCLVLIFFKFKLFSFEILNLFDLILIKFLLCKELNIGIFMFVSCINILVKPFLNFTIA